MAIKSPIFPIQEPQHFSDYGFDPQIDFFQVLGEARRHKRETARSIDSIHFKLQKPISKDDVKRTHKAKKRWWRNALSFFKRRWSTTRRHAPSDWDKAPHGRGKAFRGSISGPVYLTESRSGSGTTYKTTTRPSSGPLAGTMTPAWKGDVGIPYLCLRDLNMEPPQRISAPAMPIYLVT